MNNHDVSTTDQPRDGRQRGGAALLFLLILSVVAAMVGAIAVRGSVADLRVAGVQRSAKTGFYCAEAGLAASRAYFGSSYAQWNAMFAGNAVAGYPVTGDLDGDGLNDYQVTLQDDSDELPPLTNNPLVDNNLTAVMVSKCVSATMGTRQLQEIVMCNTRGTNYRYQSGHGSAHQGNENP